MGAEHGGGEDGGGLIQDALEGDIVLALFAGDHADLLVEEVGRGHLAGVADDDRLGSEGEGDDHIGRGDHAGLIDDDGVEAVAAAITVAEVLGGGERAHEEGGLE